MYSDYKTSNIVQWYFNCNYDIAVTKQIKNTLFQCLSCFLTIRILVPKRKNFLFFFLSNCCLSCILSVLLVKTKTSLNYKNDGILKYLNAPLVAICYIAKKLYECNLFQYTIEYSMQFFLLRLFYDQEFMRV